MFDGKLLLFCLVISSALLIPTPPAEATSLAIYQSNGVAVSERGGSDQVGSLDAFGLIEYFIPLAADGGGTYGVNNAGTVSDRGHGGAELTMYLSFLDVPQDSILTASLEFEFIDLDLANANDPTGFFETVSFSHRSGSGPIVIDSLLDTGPDYTISGNHDRQSIVFHNAASLLDLNGGGILSLGLRFTANSLSGGQNTAEQLRATLHYTSQPPTEVPEPASMLLLGFGMGGLALRRKRQSPDCLDMTQG